MSSSLEDKAGLITLKTSRQKQRVVIEFLLSEGETALDISRKMNQVYGDNTIDYSTVMTCVKQSNDGLEESGKSKLCDRSRRCRM